MGYQAGQILGSRDSLEDVIEWVEQELSRVEETFNIQDFVLLKNLHVEPVRPRDGIIVYADGSDWDPGSGEGIYAYYAAAWHKLG